MLKDHINMQTKRGCIIVACDPSQQLIEAKIQRGEVVQINAYARGPAFRWPKVGEQWIIREENGAWFLDELWAKNKEEEVQPEPGDLVLTSSSGRILIEVEGKFYRLYSSPIIVQKLEASLESGAIINH